MGRNLKLSALRKKEELLMFKYLILNSGVFFVIIVYFDHSIMGVNIFKNIFVDLPCTKSLIGNYSDANDISYFCNLGQLFHQIGQIFSSLKFNN